MSAVTARIRIVLDIVLKSYDIADWKRSDGVYSFCVGKYNPEVIVERLKDTPPGVFSCVETAGRLGIKELSTADSIPEGNQLMSRRVNCISGIQWKELPRQDLRRSP